MYLKDKVALVTGAAQGIGAAIALELVDLLTPKRQVLHEAST